MSIAMRIIVVAAVLLGGSLLIASNKASALPGISAQPGAFSASLVQEVKTVRYRKAQKYRYRRPYYVPYACSRPYRYYYWQYYPPICYPL